MCERQPPPMIRRAAWCRVVRVEAGVVKDEPGAPALWHEPPGDRGVEAGAGHRIGPEREPVPDHRGKVVGHEPPRERIRVGQRPPDSLVRQNLSYGESQSRTSLSGAASNR